MASSKTALITGNTFPVKSQLARLGGRWNPAARGWDVPVANADKAWALVGGKKKTGGGIVIASPTDEQIAIRDAVLNTTENLFFDARAGASKTTTSLWVLGMIEAEKKAMVAFNVDIKADIQDKASEDTEVLTMNGFGFRACLRHWGGNVKVDVDADYLFTVFRNMYGEDVVRARLSFFNKVKKLVELSKGALVDTDRVLTAVAEDMDILADSFDIDLNGETDEAIRCAVGIMESQRLDTTARRGMDFTDQMWLPVIQNMALPRYDVLVIDEAQDTNALQLEMLARAAANGTRVIAVGDRRQCVSVDTPVRVPGGTKRAGDLKAGDVVVAYRNGRNVEQVLNHVLPSTWTRGIKIVTESGKTLLMSPDHQIWASTPNMVGDKVLNYLMYRPGFGFRTGITNKCEDSANAYGNRTGTERAERLWVLRVNEDRDDALFWEEYYSLKYGIPTMVFEAQSRGLSVPKCERLFAEFGDNGRKLLADLDLSFEHPNWFAYSAARAKTVRRTVHLVAHSAKGSQVSLEWTGLDLDAALDGDSVSYIKEADDHRRMRKFFTNYRDAQAFGKKVAKVAKANFRERLSTDDEPISLLTASALIPTMKVAVYSEGGIALEEIASVEPVAEASFVDLDVGDASNFYGDDILSHNCIYTFRGADSNAVDNIIARFNMRVMPLTVTFRCGKAIVAEAQGIVPDFKAGPMNPEGRVRNIGIERLLAEVRPGDFVISRTNAPLVVGCIHALANGIPAAVVGRDVGGTLATLAKKLKARDVTDFEAKLSAWLKKEIARFSAKLPIREAAIENAQDKVDALLAVASGCESMDEVFARIDKLFVKDASNARVDFTSTHKAKGRERDRVFLFEDTFLVSRKNKKTGEWMPPSEEEYNLLYVAITRARHELVYVDGAKKLGGKRDA